MVSAGAPVRFVLALAALERLHQGELAALEQNLIICRGRGRFVFADLPPTDMQRPPDLQYYGATTGVSMAERTVKPAPVSASVRMVSVPSDFPERRRR